MSRLTVLERVPRERGSDDRRLPWRTQAASILLLASLAPVGGTASAQPNAPVVQGKATPEQVDEWMQLVALRNRAFANGEQTQGVELATRTLALAEAAFGPNHTNTFYSLNGLAIAYQYQGRYAEAEPLCVRALEGYERTLGRDHPNTLNAANNLAVLYLTEDRYAEAEPLFVRALEGYERTLGRDDPNTLGTVMNLAASYTHQGRYAEAEPLYNRALDGNARTLGPLHLHTLASASNLASLYKLQGRYTEAEAILMRTLEALERILGRDQPQTLNSARLLAETRLLSAQPASAIEPARLIVSSLRTRRVADPPSPSAEAQRSREEIEGNWRFSLLADAAWGIAAAGGEDRTSLAAESFTALQDATTGTTNRAVVQMAVRHVADDASAGLGALVLERESLNTQWAANSASYSAALAGSDSSAEALRQSLPAERARIEGRLDEIDAALQHDFPEYFALIRPGAVDVATTQAMLAPDEAILMVVPTQFGTHVMAISHTGLQWVRSQWTQTEVNGAVSHLLSNLRVAMTGGRFFYDRQTAHALYQQVVAPVASLLEGKRHVFIVTSGSLTTIPFGILVTDEPRGANDDPQALRATRWFADAHALIQLPSIQSLQSLRRFGHGPRQTGAASIGFVGFGDPALEGLAIARGRGESSASIASVFSGHRDRSGGGLADVSSIRRLNRLPGTAVELENIRVALGAPESSLFLAERSTERNIRTIDLSGTRVLVLATHGLVAGEARGPAEPGLVFTPPATATDEDDGFLTASEVTSLRLDADWVILSACNTAAGDGSVGAPGLSGLARAFFYAGARNLLASHWPVADEAAPRLTVRTIELMRENPALSRAEALQRAMREVREDMAHPEWAHPGVWAPFSLIGDGAR